MCLSCVSKVNIKALHSFLPPNLSSLQNVSLEITGWESKLQEDWEFKGVSTPEGEGQVRIVGKPRFLDVWLS